MEYIFGAIVAIGGIFIVLALRSLTTLFHEFGHGIPAYIFTKEEVNIFVGSFGDTQSGLSLRLGRFNVYMKLNLFNWQIGLCSHKGVQYVWQRILVIIGGPIASLLIAVPLLVYLKAGEPNQVMTTILLVFALAALLDFVVNLWPFNTEIIMQNGSVTYNDGHQLFKVLSEMNLPEEYHQMESLVYEKKYAPAIKIGEQLINNGKPKPAVFQVLVNAYEKNKDYEEALSCYEIMADNYKLKVHHYHQIARIQHAKGSYDEALKGYNYCIHYQFQSAGLYLSRGKLFLDRADYHKALKDFSTASHYDKRNQDATLYKAIAHFKLRDFDAAKRILQTLRNNKNDLADYYWAKCQMEFGNLQKALATFSKLERKGVIIHGLDYDVAELNRRITFGKT